MNWVLFLVVGGAIVLALVIAFIGKAQDKREEAEAQKG